MKSFKKFLAIVLSIAMVLGMSGISFAADDEPAALPDIVLNGGEDGGSPMIGTFTPPTSRGNATDAYKYMGWASLLDSVPDKTIAEGNYRYLVMTYTGDITQLRFEFTRKGETGDGSDDEKEGPYWFNPEGQTYYFVTADGSDIPLIGDNTTIVIDLAESVNPNALDGSGKGVGIDWYNDGIHMHCDEMVIHGNGAGYTISNAYLTTTLPVIEEETTEAPAETTEAAEETTEAPAETTEAAEETTEAPAETTEAAEETTEAPAVLPDEIVLDNEGSALIGSFDSGSDAYAYLGYVYLKEATSAYKYLKMTYTGSLKGIRLENDSTVYWFDAAQASHFVTADGSAIPLTVTEPTTIVIDLEASGLELGWDGGMHIHSEAMATNGGLEITDARLLKTYTAPVETTTEAAEETTEAAEETTEAAEVTTEAEEETTEAPVVLPDEIVLDGDEEGASSLIGSFNSGTDGYGYLGYVYLKEATSAYKYLKMTYTGSLKGIRLENDGVIYWFDAAQASHFVTADGSAIPLTVAESTTIVIDLEASGLELGWDGGMHIHSEAMVTNGGLKITDARLLKTYTVPGTITVEAEDYASMEGVAVKTVGDTDLVYTIHNNDYMNYSINVAEDGYYRLKVTAARKYKGSSVVTLREDGEIIAKAYIASTDDWNVCADNSGSLVYLTAGAHDITMYAEIGCFNIDKFALVPATVATDGIRVEAEAYTDSLGIGVITRDQADTALVYQVHNGDWLKYTVKVNTSGNYDFKVTAARKYAGKSLISLYNGENSIATARVNSTNDWNRCAENIGTSVYLEAGEYTFTLVAEIGSCNIDYFELVPTVE